MGKLVIGIIWVYQTLISPLLPPTCRFYPTCSHYARSAIRGHGVLYGLWLAFARVLKCHPWHPGGLDPVPVSRPHWAAIRPRPIR